MRTPPQAVRELRAWSCAPGMWERKPGAPGRLFLAEGVSEGSVQLGCPVRAVRRGVCTRAAAAPSPLSV